ncbi:MAG TPA: hypothetical protein ENN41_05430 [Sediminispirochaeta sp.]|nr:hypothetical protein [Sediminispirochaeta sp.]
MNKKRLVVLLLCLLLFWGAVQNSAAYSYSPDRIGFGVGTPNAVLIYRPHPFDFRGGYDFSEGNQFVFLSGDVRLIDNRHIQGPLHFSFGVGLYGKLFFERQSDMVEGGTRLPVGLSLLLFDNFLEFFVELAPGIDLYPKPAFSSDPVQVWAGITLALN